MSSAAVLPFTTSFDVLQLNTINGVLGNVSLTDLGDSLSPQDKVKAHLKYVLNILESGQFAPVSLNESQKQERRKCIDLLIKYREAGVFPNKFEYADPLSAHRPCFKDDANNVCAVGHLIERTAGMETVDKINSQFKFSYVRDMDLAMLEQWQVNHGFSLIELAMIQPSYDVPGYTPIGVSIAPVTIHQNVSCDYCGISPISGVRYKCGNCANFDMCAACESANRHDSTHILLKIRYPLAHEPDNTVPVLGNLYCVGPARKPVSPMPYPHRTD